MEAIGAQYYCKNIANPCRYAYIDFSLTLGRYSDTMNMVIIMSINENAFFPLDIDPEKLIYFPDVDIFRSTRPVQKSSIPISKKINPEVDFCEIILYNK